MTLEYLNENSRLSVFFFFLINTIHYNSFGWASLNCLNSIFNIIRIWYVICLFCHIFETAYIFSDAENLKINSLHCCISSITEQYLRFTKSHFSDRFTTPVIDSMEILRAPSNSTDLCYPKSLPTYKCLTYSHKFYQK